MVKKTQSDKIAESMSKKLQKLEAMEEFEDDEDVEVPLAKVNKKKEKLCR